MLQYGICLLCSFVIFTPIEIVLLYTNHNANRRGAQGARLCRHARRPGRSVLGRGAQRRRRGRVGVCVQQHQRGLQQVPGRRLAASHPQMAASDGGQTAGVHPAEIVSFFPGQALTSNATLNTTARQAGKRPGD